MAHTHKAFKLDYNLSLLLFCTLQSLISERKASDALVTDRILLIPAFLSRYVHTQIMKKLSQARD